jgi:hypothetical protein
MCLSWFRRLDLLLLVERSVRSRSQVCFLRRVRNGPRRVLLRGLDLRSLFFVHLRCCMYRFWILHLFASRSAIQLLLSCVGSFLGARVGLVFSIHCCNQYLMFHAVWSSVLCQLIFYVSRPLAPILTLRVQIF